MRWILALVVLAVGAWYLRSRQRRVEAPYEMPPQTWTPRQEATPAPSDGMASDSADQSPPQASTTQAAAADATSAAVGDESSAASTATSPSTTATDTAEPSLHEEVQAELADVDATVQAVRDQTQAPADSAEKSAGEAFGAGTLNETELRTAAAPPAAEVDAGEATAPPTDDADAPTTGMEQPPEIDREEVLERTSGAFIGNKSTRVFHAATANNLPAEENRVYFESVEEAVAAGFRPAANEGLESAEA